MAVYKRKGSTAYWYEFQWAGQRVRASAHTANAKIAGQVEAAHRTRLALGRVGIVEPRAVPTLAAFVSDRIEPWVKANFERQSPKTYRDWYGSNLRILSRYKPLASKPLNALTGEDAASFAAAEQTRGRKPSSVNSTLRVLRRVLHLAQEWGVIEGSPRIKLLRGEARREHVIEPHEETAYLAAATEPLRSIATMLFDSGMRPEECFRLRWESVRWDHGRYGSWLVTHGKTAAARRLLPATARVRAVLEARWEAAGRPLNGWVFAAPTRSGHAEASTVRKLHAAAVAASTVRPFVLYSIRHTFLTRLGAAGLDVWTLARIAGHNGIAMSARYVHPGEVAVLAALDRLAARTGGGMVTDGARSMQPAVAAPVAALDRLPARADSSLPHAELAPRTAVAAAPAAPGQIVSLPSRPAQLSPQRIAAAAANVLQVVDSQASGD